MNKRYSDLIKFQTFEERFEYLKLDNDIGVQTFGWNRYLNQALYHSEEWKNFRKEIIIRDNGCDLGTEEYPILSKRIIIHHINPITKNQILNRDPIIFDPENVICCRHETHLAIHYGSIDSVEIKLIERKHNDTCPWRR